MRLFSSLTGNQGQQILIGDPRSPSPPHCPLTPAERPKRWVAGCSTAEIFSLWGNCWVRSTLPFCAAQGAWAVWKEGSATLYHFVPVEKQHKLGNENSCWSGGTTLEWEVREAGRQEGWEDLWAPKTPSIFPNSPTKRPLGRNCRHNLLAVPETLAQALYLLLYWWRQWRNIYFILA